MKTMNVKELAQALELTQAAVRKKVSSNELPILQAGRAFISTETGLNYYKFTQEHKITLDSLKMKAKILSFVNHKGGCSKTTTAYTIAALLQSFGNKVLLVDLDPQGNSTQSVLEPFLDKDGITLPYPKTIKNLLLDRKEGGEVGIKRIKEVIQASKFGFDCIPCDLSLNSIMPDLESSSFKEVILKELLNEISSEYDYIILDTPPTLGFSVISALTASDYVAIVTLAEAFSLLGVEQTVNLINSVKSQNSVLANPRQMKILGIIISKAEMNTNISRHFVSELQIFSDERKITLFTDDIIPKTTKIPETQATGELITIVDPKGDAALSYFNIAMLMDMEIKKDRIKEKLSN